MKAVTLGYILIFIAIITDAIALFTLNNCMGKLMFASTVLMIVGVFFVIMNSKRSE